MALVLTRKIGEQIVIDERTTVTVGRIDRGKVVLMVAAPTDVSIRRAEIPYKPRTSEGHDEPELETADDTDGAAPEGHGTHGCIEEAGRTVSSQGPIGDHQDGVGCARTGGAE